MQALRIALPPAHAQAPSSVCTHLIIACACELGLTNGRCSSCAPDMSPSMQLLLWHQRRAPASQGTLQRGAQEWPVRCHATWSTSCCWLQQLKQRQLQQVHQQLKPLNLPALHPQRRTSHLLDELRLLVCLVTACSSPVRPHGQGLEAGCCTVHACGLLALPAVCSSPQLTTHALRLLCQQCCGRSCVCK